MYNWVLASALFLGLCAGDTCKVENCRTCVEGSLEKCAFCNDNYGVVVETGLCAACSSGTWGPQCTTRKCIANTRVHCLECGYFGRCWKCVDGYKVDTWGECRACPAGTSGYECTVLVCEGILAPNCESCSVSVPTHCGSCKADYMVDESTGQCIPCPTGRSGRNCTSLKCGTATLANCLECDKDNPDRCGKCYDDYMPSSTGVCQACPENRYGPLCTVTKCNGVVADHCSICYAKGEKDAAEEPGACKVCNDGYYKTKDSPNTCTLCPNDRLSNGIVCNAVSCQQTRRDNCDRCAADSAKCETCLAGYSPDSDGACQPCAEGFAGVNCLWRMCTLQKASTVDDCEYCTMDESCAQCLTGYKLVGNECLPVDGCKGSNCRSCRTVDGAEVCKRCEKGYYLLDGSCAKCGNTCAECSSVNTCTECINGYTLKENVCVPNMPDIVTSGCTTENCYACKGADHSVCVTCSGGFVLSDPDKTCVKACADANCKDCDQATSHCKSCITGYGISGQFCAKCSENCDTCSFVASAPVEACTICATGYTYSESARKCVCPEGRGGPSCSLTSCSASQKAANEDCEFCNSDGSCLQCTAGYIISGGECVPVGGCTLRKCQSCYNANNQEVCKRCETGYYVQGGSCSRCPGACKVCANADTCLKCDRGYSISGGKCVCPPNMGGPNCDLTKCTAEQVAVVDDCQFCNADGTCFQCKENYKLVNNECLPTVLCSTPGCRSCSSPGGVSEVCKRCSEGYLFTDGSCVKCLEGCAKCQSSSTCDTCFEGYLPDSSSSRCTPTCTDTNCSSCDRLTGACSVCVSGHGLHDGVCRACGLASCGACRFSPDMDLGELKAICTECLSGSLTADGQCSVVRKSGLVTISTSVSAAVFILVGLTIAPCIVLRKRRARVSSSSSDSLVVMTTNIFTHSTVEHSAAASSQDKLQPLSQSRIHEGSV